MPHRYYKVKNAIIHLNSIRSVSLCEQEKRIYITYKTGNTTIQSMTFDTIEEARKEFTNIENVLGVFTYV